MKKVFLLFAALLAPIFALYGQEKTEWIYKMYGEHSIIREVSDGKWLVHSDCNGPEFMMVEDGVANVNVLVMPSAFKSVSDFVIDGNTVYFCGMLYSGVPAMGCFSLTVFPAGTVYYSEMTGVDTLKAIEVMMVGESLGPHVVMIGEQNGMGILVDAIPSGTGWNTYYILLLTQGGNYTVHTDLAITDSNVVVTSYNTKLEADTDMDTIFALAQGYIWFVKRPTAGGVSLAANVPKYTHVPQIKRFSPFLVTACGGDCFIAATVAFVFDGMSYIPGINIYGYCGMDISNNLRIVGITSLDNLRDICHDNLSRTTEVLSVRRIGTLNESRIYTVDPATPLSTSGHRYPDQLLNSLIPQSPHGNLFIGSGVDINDIDHLYLYRYNNTDSGTCTDSFDSPEKELEVEIIIKGNGQYTFIFHERMSATPGNMETQIGTICEYAR